jgi:fructokinase
LIGRTLVADLERTLGRPVRVMNDANCFAISEATDGAAAGAACVFGVILGTGVGGGIVINGRVLDGANLIAGEWGHNPLPWMLPDETPVRPATAANMDALRRGFLGRRSNASSLITLAS